MFIDFSRLHNLRPAIEGARFDHGYDMMRLGKRWSYEEGYADEDGNVTEWRVWWTPLWWKILTHCWSYLRWSGPFEINKSNDRYYS